MGDGGSGEKTEEPTPEKLRHLREDGNIPKSQDVIQALSLIACLSVFALAAGFIGRTLTDFMTEAFSLVSSRFVNSNLIYPLLLEALKAMFFAILPIISVAVFIGLVGNYAQVGVLFTTKPLEPNFNKLNPVNGIKGLFNTKKLFELGKNLAKFSLVGYIAYDSLSKRVHDVVLTIRMPIYTGVGIIGSIIWDFTVKIIVAFGLIAAADYFFQRHKFMKDNMMSKHDIKQEYKQSEGDPQHKAERKKFHHELVSGGGRSNIKKADAVVVNPDHIAVALKYDKDGSSAPIVVAKGERVQAEKIKEIAKQAGIPIIRNIPLAQALNKMEIGDEIPEELYDAVAEVLNFVYQLSEQQREKKRKK